jgi:hypothetical protein
MRKGPGMSKVDAMRALKQARLEQLRAAAPARPVAPRATPAPAAPAPRAVPDGACGHRNMSGRSCTRASGHSEKSHRYG